MRTLIVRVFQPAADTGPLVLQGVVEDVRSGVSTPFRGGERLLAAITQALARDDDPDGDGGVVGPDG